MCAGLILLVTLVTALIWSHFRLFWVDELLEFYTDSKPTVGSILWGQLHAPFSFEPPMFHLFLHLVLRVIPGPELAARLVSIVSLLVTEACAFVVTRKLTHREMPSLLAMILPFLLASIDYAAEARIYSLQLATLAVAILCYQRIVMGAAQWRWRVGLGLSIAVAVLTHYFGVVVIAPLWIAEAVRSLQRRRVDWAVCGAIFTGTAFAVFDIPFARELGIVRAHYYNTGETSWWMVPFTYLWLKYHFAIYPLMFSHLRRARSLGVLMMLGTFVAICSALQRHRREQLAVVTALSVAALLPILNLAVAQLAKAYWPRYSLPAVFGISVLGALFASTFLSEKMLAAVGFVLLGWGLIYSFGQIRMFRAWNYQMRAASFSPRQEKVLASIKDRHIYIQDTAKYLVLHRYKDEPFVGLQSPACELLWSGHNSDSLIGQNMARTAGVPFESFSAMYVDGEPHVLLYYGDWSNEWIDQELMADHAEVTRIGGAFEGQLAVVRFTHGQTCDR